MRTELLNVECEFQVPVVFGRRNVYVTTVDTAASTSDMNNIAFRLCAMGYQSIHVTNQRTGNNETKAYPTIRTYPFWTYRAFYVVLILCYTVL